MTTATFVELHDSRVKGVVLRADATCDIEFSHLYVFERIAPERYEGWSYRGTLRLDGVTEATLVGSLSGDDYIAEGQVLAVDGVNLENREDLFTTELSTDCSEVAIRFFSGVSLIVKGTHVRFDSMVRVEAMEPWIGPLGAGQGGRSQSR